MHFEAVINATSCSTLCGVLLTVIAVMMPDRPWYFHKKHSRACGKLGKIETITQSSCKTGKMGRASTKQGLSLIYSRSICTSFSIMAKLLFTYLLMTDCLPVLPKYIRALFLAGLKHIKTERNTRNSEKLLLKSQ